VIGYVIGSRRMRGGHVAFGDLNRFESAFMGVGADVSQLVKPAHKRV
jgi:hypothetical protein